MSVDSRSLLTHVAGVGQVEQVLGISGRHSYPVPHFKLAQVTTSEQAIQSKVNDVKYSRVKK